jgi:hypothetical protein
MGCGSVCKITCKLKVLLLLLLLPTGVEDSVYLDNNDVVQPSVFVNSPLIKSHIQREHARIGQAKRSG